LRGSSARVARKAANEAAAQTANVAGQALGAVAEYAHRIELRADALETAVGTLEIKARHWDSFRLRSFAGRLAWLLTGR
jgi:predicted Zn-dependent protease